jgi:hypothetical protein
MIGGDVRTQVVDDDGFKKAAAAHEQRDKERLAHEAKEQEQRDGEHAQKRAAAASRFLVTAAHFAGIKHPSQIARNELEDIYRAATLMQKDVPDPDAWMQATCPAPQEPEPPTDFHAYIAGARASLVRRKEIVKEAS